MHGERVHVSESMGRESLDHAVRFLERCWFIGFTEHSQTDIPLVCQAVGVRSPRQRSNVSRQHLKDADLPRVRRLIEIHDAIDMELYETACRIRGVLPTGADDATKGENAALAP